MEFIDLPPMLQAAGSVRLPGSKSISNRVLLLSALCAGRTTLHDLLDSDDTRVMLDALQALGCTIARSGSSVTIDGLAGQLPQRQAALFLGNAGTAMRLLAGLLAAQSFDSTLIGDASLSKRPMVLWNVAQSCSRTAWPSLPFERSYEDRHPLAASGDRCLQPSNLDLETVIQPAHGLDMVRLDLEHAAPQPAPFKSVGGITQGLQGQSQFRLSCHCVPMCSG